MIPWYQGTIFDLRAFAKLPKPMQARVVDAREHQLNRELDTLPGFTEQELEALEVAGVCTKLENLCPRLLRERDRKNRAKSKESESVARAEDAPSTPEARSQDDIEKTREEKTREDKTREDDPPPAKPARRGKAKKQSDGDGEPVADDWQPTQAHRDFAALHGINVDVEAFGFRGWAAGQRFRSVNGRFASWLARSAGDKAQKPGVKATGPAGWNDGDMMLGIPRGKTS